MVEKLQRRKEQGQFVLEVINVFQIFDCTNDTKSKILFSTHLNLE